MLFIMLLRPSRLLLMLVGVQSGWGANLISSRPEIVGFLRGGLPDTHGEGTGVVQLIVQFFWQ